jgi:protein-S-isoprenylcysteine O-methyltransferase Ste14
MPSLDLAIYAAHAAFWGAFGITRLIVRDRKDAAPAAVPPPATEQPKTAPFSRALLVLNMFAFGTMYFGLGLTVLPDLVPDVFPGQRIAGTLVMALGSGLMCWSLVYFRSWRFRAKLDEGHQLATGGPFRLLRHPIYMGLNLLALGTAVWVPTPITAVAVVLMVIGSDLRARAEEKILGEGFGDAYRSYCARTRRFIPGIY